MKNENQPTISHHGYVFSVIIFFSLALSASYPLVKNSARKDRVTMEVDKYVYFQQILKVEGEETTEFLIKVMKRDIETMAISDSGKLYWSVLIASPRDKLGVYCNYSIGPNLEQVDNDNGLKNCFATFKMTHDGALLVTTANGNHLMVTTSPVAPER